MNEVRVDDGHVPTHGAVLAHHGILNGEWYIHSLESASRSLKSGKCILDALNTFASGTLASLDEFIDEHLEFIIT